MSIIAQIIQIQFEKHVYDSDGLAIDERLESGHLSRHSFKYILFRCIEFISIRTADLILTRSIETEGFLRAKYQFVREKKFIRLVNGRSQHDFYQANGDERAKLRTRLGFSSDQIIFIYSGSLGPQYLIEEMFRIFRNFYSLNKSTSMLIITHEPAKVIEKLIQPHVIGLMNSIKIYSSNPKEIGDLLRIGDLGFSLRASLNSMRHVAPLKFREYLLSGVPVIYTDNTGDDWEVPTNFGFRISNIENLDLDILNGWIIEYIVNQREESRSGARKFAVKHFDIEKDIATLYNSVKSI